MAEIESELLRIRKLISDNLQKQSEYKAKYDLLIDKLKTEFDCDSIEEAKKLLQELKNKIVSLQKKIDSSISKIKEELGID
jgi:Zn-dependent M32 family carboxypeptidase